MSLLSSLDVLQVSSPRAAKPCVRAVEFAGQLALKSGANVQVASDFPARTDSFLGRGKPVWRNEEEQSVAQWAGAADNRVLLLAGVDDDFRQLLARPGVSAVEISMENWQSESTLFAQSGLAELLGDPERAPLIPAGYYAAASIGYAGFTALLGVYAKLHRFAVPEVATVNGLAVLGWINWKAAAAGAMGTNIHREGQRSEWPIIPCKDGYVALVFTERDWDRIVSMIGNRILSDQKFSTFAGRQEHRGEYMAIIQDWAASKSKSELAGLFYENAIPGAAVATPSDLLNDPLLQHRSAFSDVFTSKGQAVRSPVAPHRVTASVKADPSSPPDKGIKKADNSARLPLEGLRVLDLGIITAGAGTTGLLADMGAEVLKVESHNYPDPFRLWAGSSNSPLFNFNNRNKYGLAIDLKTAQGKKRFLELAATSDVVVENFRRGVLDRMGFSLNVLREANPNIVLASVSGLGLDGPGSDHTTFGSTLEAASGFAAQTCYADGMPYITGRNVNYPDQIVCFYAAAMIIAAILQCRDAGCAMQIDIAQRDVAMFILGEVFEYISGGGSEDVSAIRAALSDYDIDACFPSRDDRWVALVMDHAANQAGESPFGFPIDHQSLAHWTAGQSSEEIIAAFAANGLGAARVLSGSELYAHPVIREQRVFMQSPGGNLVKGFPFQLRHSRMTIWGDAPSVGQHSDRFA